jgi:hypothetical protein
MKTLLLLPGEEPSMWVGTACGALSPRESRNAGRMHRGFAEEAVVVVKRMAEEDRVTYLRIKPYERARKEEMKGGTC